MRIGPWSGGLKRWSLDRARLREKTGPRLTQVRVEVQIDLGERAGLESLGM